MSYRSATNLFDEWKAAHDHLTRATQSFFDACTTLLQFIDESPAGSAREKVVEDTLMGVYDHTETFSTVEKQVRESHVILRRITNKSITLVPINVLPPEVLSHIFTLLAAPSACVNERCSDGRSIGHNLRRYRSHPLVVIPSVCTHWRWLAIHTPSLWSHVDIGHHIKLESEANIFPRARLWLERARGAPLFLHVELRERRLGGIWDLVSLLKPYIANLTSLSLSGQCGVYFGPILNLYANTYPLGSLISLLVELNGSELIPDPPVWPINALRGLSCLKLRLLHEDTLLGMDGLVTILANSPALHTLQLDSALSATDSRHSYPKISLPRLQILQLGCRNGGVLPILLSILVPGSLEIDVRLVLGVQIDQKSHAAIQSFLKRINITRLNLWGGPLGDISWLVEQLDCVPRLRTLVLERCGFNDWAILDALTLPTMEDKFSARCPSLRMISIDGHPVGLKAYTQIKRIVSCHQLSTIVFGKEATIAGGIRNEAIEWLSQRIGDVTDYPPKRRREVSRDWDDDD